MPILQIETHDPKVEKLLRELADRKLIAIRKEFDEGDGIVRTPRYFGCGKDIIKAIHPSFDDPLEEFKEYE